MLSYILNNLIRKTFKAKVTVRKKNVNIKTNIKMQINNRPKIPHSVNSITL